MISILLRSHSISLSESDSSSSSSYGASSSLVVAYCYHIEVVQSFGDGKHCREAPARACVGLDSSKDAQPHKQQSSREELLEGRTMGKWNRNPWTSCRHSGGFASKSLHDDNVANILHTPGENTKMH